VARWRAVKDKKAMDQEAKDSLLKRIEWLKRKKPDGWRADSRKLVRIISREEFFVPEGVTIVRPDDRAPEDDSIHGHPTALKPWYYHLWDTADPENAFCKMKPRG
jgi:hypothetical protein